MHDEQSLKSAVEGALRYDTKVLVERAKKEKKSIKSASIYRKVAKVFRAKDSTLLDLAEVVDANIKFTDE